nr:MAG TPA: hypothetical protein [Bacteriophage sp.]DAY70485.1 MAG TPA: hypothetical protein [Caudoviricetes sp.]DAZ54813.1 MAG TPA: hypothetical protein [Caudoviricetes sp.]
MLWCIKVLIGVNFNVSGVLFTLPPQKKSYICYDIRPSTLPDKLIA